jgi:hypothetical protein
MGERLMETVAGWSAALPPWTCRRSGAAFDLTLYTVAAVLFDDAGAEISLEAGSLAKLDQVTNKGKVQLTPNDDGSTFDPTTFTLTRNQKVYTVRVKATDSNGRDVFFPDREAAEILVHKR